MTKTIRETLESYGTYTETEVKVFEIMEYLIGNVEDSYIQPVYNCGEYELGITRTNYKEDYLFGRGGKFYYTRTNKEEWTLVEAFVRQYLNNGSDGFGLLNVEECFNYIMDNIDFIIEQDMISETGWSKAGYALWTNYRPKYPNIQW